LGGYLCAGPPLRKPSSAIRSSTEAADRLGTQISIPWRRRAGANLPTTFAGFETLQSFPAPTARGAVRCAIPIPFLDFSMGCNREKFPPRLCRRQFAGRLRGFRRRDLRQREVSTAMFAFGSIAQRSAKASETRSRLSETEVFGLLGHGGFPVHERSTKQDIINLVFQKEKCNYSGKETALDPSPLLRVRLQGINMPVMDSGARAAPNNYLSDRVSGDPSVIARSPCDEAIQGPQHARRQQPRRSYCGPWIASLRSQ
jgi:hypothetical protein